MEKLANVHPGDILKLDFLDEYGLSAYRLAKEIGVPPIRISEIIRRKRAITPDTALRLGRYFGTSAELWIDLQRDYDLEEVADANKSEYDKITPIQPSKRVAA